MNFKKYFLILSSFLSAVALSHAEVPGKWVSHPALDIYSYLYASKYTRIDQATNNVQKLIDTDRYLYALITGGYYTNPSSTSVDYAQTPLILARYDKADPDGRMKPVANILSTSGIGVSALEYSQSLKCMAVAYDNGCFDLIFNDGRLLSNSELKNFLQPGGTKVRSISFSADGQKVVMASDFGILIVDLQTAGIDKMLNFKRPVDFANIFGNNIIAAVDDVLHVFPTDSQPLDITLTPCLISSADNAPAGVLEDEGRIKSSFGLYPISDNTLLFFAPALTNVDGISINILTLPENPAEEECRVANIASTSVNYGVMGARADVTPSYRERPLIAPTRDGWMFHNETDVYMINVLGKTIDYSQPDAVKNYVKNNFYTLRKDQVAAPDAQAGPERYKACATYDGQNFWFLKPRQGFYQRSVTGTTNAAKWTTFGSMLELDAMACGMPKFLYYSPKYGLIARNNGRNHHFAIQDNGLSDGLCSYKNGEWTIHTVSKTNYKNGWLYGTGSLLLGDNEGAVPDPVYPDYVYMRSEDRGIRRHNLADYDDIMLFARSNYAPNFANRVSISQPQNGSIYVNLTAFSEFDFDNDGTLWTAFCRFQSNTHPRQGELWYWTAEDRGQVKDKSGYPGHEMKIIEIPGIEGPMHGYVHAAKMEKNNNLILHLADNTWYDSYVYDHNGTLSDTSDDKWVVLKDVIDENGQGIERISWPYGFIEDPYDGAFIIGSQSGVFVTTREDLFNGDKPRITWLKPLRESDGACINNFGSAADNGPVGMTLDGEGRKWFVFGNGQIVCLSPDRSKIVAEFDPVNSPIPNTTYLSVAYNPETNSLFFGSYYGLMEYRLEGGGQYASDDFSPYVYPRLAEPHYAGHINFSGLQDTENYFLIGPDNQEFLLPNSSAGKLQIHPADYPAGRYYLKDHPSVEFILNK